MLNCAGSVRFFFRVCGANGNEAGAPGVGLRLYGAAIVRKARSENSQCRLFQPAHSPYAMSSRSLATIPQLERPRDRRSDVSLQYRTWELSEQESGDHHDQKSSSSVEDSCGLGQSEL